jgi:hypothetical protein
MDQFGLGIKNQGVEIEERELKIRNWWGKMVKQMVERALWRKFDLIGRLRQVCLLINGRGYPY